MIPGDKIWCHLAIIFILLSEKWPVISYVQSSIRQNTQFSEFLLISGSIVAIERQCGPVPRGTVVMLS